MLLGCLVIAASKDFKEDPTMGKVKNLYCIDNDYMKFTFSGCGMNCMTVKMLDLMSYFAMKRQEDVSRECEQIIGQ